MELRNLKTFEAVCRWGSFTAAAEGLGYAQSSVTAQIKQLEQETDCVLFDRLGKTPTLTAQGRCCWITPGRSSPAPMRC